MKKTYDISELPFASVSKRVFLRNHSCENVFRVKVYFHANKSHFNIKAFARGIVLKWRHEVTRKWSLTFAEQPSQRPVAKPPNHRVTPTDHLTGTGASSVFPPTLPSPPAVPENRRPTSFGTGFPPAPMQGNFNSPSQSPFGGFGLSGGWGSGVWAPNSSSASGSGGTSPGAHGLQVMLFYVVQLQAARSV